MNRIRVLMLGWEYPPRITGGLGIACHGLVTALQECVDLQLILPTFSAFSAYGSYTSYGQNLFNQVKAFADAALTTPVNQPDILHAHDWLTFPAALALRSKLDLPLVLHVHSTHYDRSCGETSGRVFQIEHHAFQTAEHIIPVSRYTANILQTHYAVPQQKLTPVHNALAGSSPRRKINRKYPTICFVGRFTAQKRPDLFINIAKQVLKQHPQAQFIMIGDGEMRPGIMQNVADCGLAGCFSFPGFLSQQEIRSHFSTCDVLCMPSFSEPFGLAALEAAAAGLAVVMSAESGAPEVLPGARVAPACSSECFSKHISELLSDPIARASGIQRNLDTLSTLKWNKSAVQTVHIYRDILNRP